MSTSDSSSAGGASARRWLIATLRLVVSAVLLAVVFTVAPAEQVLRSLRGASSPFLLVACLLFLLGQLLNVWRWRILLALSSDSVPSFGFLFRLVLIGMFFNFFLPSTVGGDVLRAEIAHSRIGSRAVVYTSVLGGRLLALVAVVLIGLAASAAVAVTSRAMDPTTGPSLSPTMGPVLVLYAALLLGTLVFFAAVSGKRWHAWQARLDETPLGSRLAGVAQTVRTYAESGGTLLWVMALSVLGQLFGNVLVVWALARALGLETSMALHLVAIPLITLATLLPIAINGIGVREGGFVLLYGDAGIASEQAIALSFGYTFVLVVFSAVGGLCLALQRGKPEG